jgi:hypothetical protein
MPRHSLRIEVLDFIRATEELLSPDMLMTHLTLKECDIVCYYLIALSGNTSPVGILRSRLGLQLVRPEIANFEQAAQSLVAVTMLSFCPFTEEEQVIVAYFLTRLQEELVLPGY